MLDCSQPNIKLMNLSATENTIKNCENLCQNGNFFEKNVRLNKTRNGKFQGRYIDMIFILIVSCEEPKM